MIDPVHGLLLPDAVCSIEEIIGMGFSIQIAHDIATESVLFVATDGLGRAVTASASDADIPFNSRGVAVARELLRLADGVLDAVEEKHEDG